MTIDLSAALLQLTGDLFAGAVFWAILVSILASWRRTARWAIAITPRALRAALFTGISGAVALNPVRAMAGDLDGLPLPERPVTSTISDQMSHTVEPGQSLWSIAASTSPPDASAGEIADSASRWYATNRLVIGADPNLILPGQVLAPPLSDER
jgi:hypothetical protein